MARRGQSQIPDPRTNSWSAEFPHQLFNFQLLIVSHLQTGPYPQRHKMGQNQGGSKWARSPRPKRIPLPEGALRLPLSTRAPRAVALLGYGRVDTLRLVERLTHKATTGRGHPGPKPPPTPPPNATADTRIGSYVSADGLTPPNGLPGP